MKIREWEATDSVREEMTVFQWSLFDDGKLAYREMEVMHADGSTEPLFPETYHVVATVLGADPPNAAEHLIVGQFGQVLQRVL